MESSDYKRQTKWAWLKCEVLFSCVCLMVAGCAHSRAGRNTTEKSVAHSPAVSAETTRIDLESSPFRAWATGTWDAKAFSSGLRFAKEGDARTRALALEKLFSKRRSMSEPELRDFHRLLAEQVRAATDDPHVVATSIHTLAGLLDYLQAKGLASKAEIVAAGELLASYMNNSTLDLQVRGAAIRAVGDLGITTGRNSIVDMLSDVANVNTPEITRNGCLALVKLANEESFGPIRRVFERTADSSVFGTAAFCLGQINNAAAMSALVENSSRFPDSASCDSALVNMDKVILETLSQPNSPAAIAAIQATEHLWKDGQREKYIPALQGLLADSSLTVKRASCERLIDAASRLPLSQEKQELAVTLQVIQQTPELGDYAERIRKRLSAVVLPPTTLTMPFPLQSHK